MDVVITIKKAYKEFKKLRLDKMHNTRVPVNTSGYDYFDEKIKQDIQLNIKEAEKYSFTFQNVNVSISMANLDDLKDFLIYHSCFLIYLFTMYARKHLDRLDIMLIGYEGEKKLPEKGKAVTPYHVNGGVTLSGASEASIVVYRREEVIKVLTHEMIHAFHLDAKFISSEQESFFNEYFNITCKSVTINESFTDALAIIINTVLYGILHGNLKKCFKKEIDHILKQARTILIHYGYQKKNGKLIVNTPVCERTHTVSYYVLKAVVFSNLEEFLLLLGKNNMCISIDEYMAFLRAKLPDFAKNINLNVVKSENLKMSSLDMAENYIKLRSN